MQSTHVHLLQTLFFFFLILRADFVSTNMYVYMYTQACTSVFSQFSQRMCLLLHVPATALSAFRQRVYNCCRYYFFGTVRGIWSIPICVYVCTNIHAPLSLVTAAY